MNQQSIISTQDVAKAPPTLDKIPEDVQLAIIKFIQSWKRSEGTEQEREKGKRARDSALRAVALSCRNLLSIYQSELLTNVTLNFRSLFRFYLLLVRNRDARKLVRSITFALQDVEQLSLQQKAEFRKDLPETINAFRDQGIRFESGIAIECVVEGVYHFLPNIQTLIILQSDFNIALQSTLANDRLAPLPFLTHSLKKLFIPLWGSLKHNLKARNVVWILVFCTGLRSAALCCVFDENDFKYLAEFSDTFSGSSKVLKLSLGLNFTPAESIRRYWDAGVGRQWIGGNQKTEAMFNLLKVTKSLQCLEINYINSVAAVQSAQINPCCLSALRSSYGSLEYIRLLGLGVKQDDSEARKASTNFSLFQRLKMLSLDATMLLLLSMFPDIKFPPGLKIFCLPYYYGYSTIQEDSELAYLLQVGSLTTLEAVVVPSNPILRDGTVSDSDDFKKGWLEGRRELEKAEVVKSGKVELRIVEPGEFIGASSETDFMSTLSWISPP